MTIDKADGQPLKFRLLATQKQLPPDSEWQGPGMLMKLAEDDAHYQELWSWFRLEGSASQVNWQTEAVLYIGIGESGTCSLQLAALSRTRDAVLMAHLADTRHREEGDVCTGDYTPRAFVVAVSKSDLPAGKLLGGIKNMNREPPIQLR